MSIQNLPLMRAMSAKMDYLNQRQDVLARNIANADTPGFRPKDLTKVDFGSVLKDVQDGMGVTLRSTNPMHMPGPGVVERAKGVGDKVTYEVAPDKNGVILEEQMVKATTTQMDYNLLTSLMSKQSAMYKVALGRQG